MKSRTHPASLTRTADSGLDEGATSKILSAPLLRSYRVVLQELTTSVREQWAWPSPEAGLVLYFYDGLGMTPPLAPTPELGEHEDRFSQAPVLAAAGYLIAASGEEHGTTVHNAWAEGLSRLADRDPFPSDRASFFFRPAELLGIAVGARSCRSITDDLRKWLREVMLKGEERAETADDWAYWLSALAAYQFGCSWSTRPLLTPEMSIYDLAVLLWLCHAEPDFAATSGIAAAEQDLRTVMLEQAALETSPPISLDRSAVLHGVLLKSVSRLVETAAAIDRAPPDEDAVLKVRRAINQVRRLRELARKVARSTEILCSMLLLFGYGAVAVGGYAGLRELVVPEGTPFPASILEGLITAAVALVAVGIAYYGQEGARRLASRVGLAVGRSVQRILLTKADPPLDTTRRLNDQHDRSYLERRG